jgi:ubiquitin-conjugating enzyme E2 I
MTSKREDRLKLERKQWNQNPPYGFTAKPTKNADGTNNLGKWLVVIPGPEGTPWEGGNYKALLLFPENYPISPPTVQFTPPLLHPNVFNDGAVCLTLVDPTEWSVGTSVTAIVKGLQIFLAEPNIKSPANRAAVGMLSTNPAGYANKIREYAKTVA